jgi:hypothetical protein
MLLAAPETGQSIDGVSQWRRQFCERGGKSASAGFITYRLLCIISATIEAVLPLEVSEETGNSTFAIPTRNLGAPILVVTCEPFGI